MMKFGTLALGAVTGIFLAGSASAFTLFTDQTLYEAEVASLGAGLVGTEGFDGNINNSSPTLTILGDQKITNERLQNVAGNNASLTQSTTFQFIMGLLGFSGTVGSLDSGEDVDIFVDGSSVGTLTSGTTFFGVTADLAGPTFTSVEFRDTNGNSVFYLDDLAAVAAVPVPAGAALLITALGGFGALRRREKAAPQA